MSSRVAQFDSSGDRIIGEVEVTGNVQLYTLLVDANVVGDAPGELAPGVPGMIFVPVAGYVVSDAPTEGTLTTAPVFLVGLLTEAFGFGEMGALTPFDTNDPADWAKNTVGGTAFSGVFTSFPSGAGQPAAVQVQTASVGLGAFPCLVCVLGMYMPAFA